MVPTGRRSAVHVKANRHGLVMRDSTGGAEMVTPTDEPLRTITTAGHQSLLIPYHRTGQARPVTGPLRTQPTRERWALLVPTPRAQPGGRRLGFRTLEPHEVAAAMAFPAGYVPLDLPKRARVKLAGNAVTAPVMTWVTGRVLQALEAA